MEESQEVPGRLLIPGGDAAILLDQVDEPLHLVPFLIEMLIIGPRLLPVLLGRDQRLGPAPLDPSHQVIAVIPLVGDGRPRIEALEQGRALTDIRRLAGRQDEPHRVAQGVDDDVDLGAESAARSPQRLVAGPPFFPAACWCARTIELSSSTHSRSGS